jgi:hypothetical protein
MDKVQKNNFMYCNAPLSETFKLNLTSALKVIKEQLISA